MIQFSIILVLNAGLLYFIYVALKRRLEKELEPGELYAKVRAEVGMMIKELNQTTDRSIALIEDKVTALEEVITKADKRIGVIRRELEKEDAGNKLYAELGRRQPITIPEKDDSGDGENEARAIGSVSTVTAHQTTGSERTSLGQVRTAAGDVTAAISGIASDESELPAKRTETVKDRRAEVSRLHRLGMEPPEIASRLEMPVGEVELVLSLQQGVERLPSE